MDKVTTLPLLAKQLAELTHTDEGIAREFLQQLFAEVTDALVNGDSVHIKNIGTFSRNGMDPSTISFVPDPIIADAINAPFAAFQPIEIDGDISEDDISAIFYDDKSDGNSEEPNPFAEIVEENVQEENDADKSADDIFFEDVSYKHEPIAESSEQEDQIPAPPPFVGIIVGEDAENEDENSTDVPAESESESEPEPYSEPESEPEGRVESEISPINTVQEPDSTSYPERKTIYYHGGRSHSHPRPLFGNWCLLVLGIVVGLIIGIGIGYFFHDNIRRAVIPVPIEHISPIDDEQPEDSVSDTSTQADLSVTSTEASDPKEDVKNEVKEPTKEKVKPAEPMYDTITNKRFLTTMAREHYGEMDYWVYIYQENSANLGNPNRIPPGTKVVIPPLEKYVPDNSPAKRSENLRKAREISAEIYSRYK